MKKRLLYATNNVGKFSEVKGYLEPLGIEIFSPRDLGLDIDPDETGDTFAENALIKAKAFLEVVDDDVIVMADDSGIEIDCLGGKPGVHTRRWAGHQMTDREIIDYCVAQLAGVPKELRGATFRTTIALGVKGSPIELFEGVTVGSILEANQDEYIRPGHPFRGLFFIPELNMLESEAQLRTRAGKMHFLTQRERAVEKALPALKKLLD